MTINKIYPESARENKKLVYALTRGASISPKVLDDRDTFTPTAYAEYTDMDAKGEEHTILSVMTEELGVISTISETFRREFYAMTEIMGDEPFQARVIHGKSKAGREFISCTMVL